MTDATRQEPARGGAGRASRHPARARIPGMALTAMLAWSSLLWLAAAATASASEAPDPEPPAVPVIAVPAASAAPVLDGELGEGEWEGAVLIPSTDSSEMRLLSREGELWLALRAPGPTLASVCLTRGDRVVVAHASAALGTAVYAAADGAWQRQREFSWCCRQGDAEESASLWRSDGWTGTVQRQGEPGVVEMRLDPAHDLFSGAGPLRLAAVSYAFETDTRYVAPADLADACADLDLVRGTAAETLTFAPETWMVLELPGAE